MAEEAGADDVERRGEFMRQESKSSNFAQNPNNQAPAYILQQERLHLPLLIPLIVVANVIVLIITMCINNCPKNTGKEKCFANFLGRLSFQPLGENPLFGPSSQTLLKLGALDANKVIHEHQGWRLITCMWLHAGIVHLLANMLSVLVVGIRLEQESGYFKISVIYLVSGFGGSLLSALFLQDQISVGASGALFGLLGAMLSELMTNWTIYTNKCAALSTLVLVVGVNLAVGILPHVDNFAHIGGFVTGFLSGFVLLVKPQYGWMSKAHVPPGYDTHFLAKRKHKGSQYALCIVAFVTLTVGFITVIVLVFRGVDGNQRCTWCHYLSCVPTSHWKCNDNAGVCNTYSLEDSLELTCRSNNKTTTTSLNTSSSTLLSLCTELCN